MFETFSAITLLISVMVPGYIFQRVRARFFVLHRENLAEMAMMHYAISGMAVTAITWPVSTLLGVDALGLMLAATNGKGVVTAIQSAPGSWIMQLFIVPALLAIFFVYLTRIPFITKLPAMLKLKPLEKEPDAVNEMVSFMKKHHPYVEVLLKNGSAIYGKMSPGSAISVSEPYPDLFLGPIYVIKPGEEVWTPLGPNTAVFIRGSDVKAVFLYSEVALTSAETVHEQDK